MYSKVVALGVVQNYVVGWVLHYVYLGQVDQALGTHTGHGTAEASISPMLHFLRDSTLALPVTIAVLLVVAFAGRTVCARIGLDADSVRARIAFAVAAAVAAAVASVPEVLAHSRLFDEQIPGVSLASHLTGVALVTLRYTFALTLVAAVLFGVPWRATSSPLETQHAY